MTLTGCAHKSKLKNEKPFASLCLSGEGKGRIEHLDGRYVFSFENLLNSTEKEWLLALSLPLHGEEVLTLSYGEADKSRVQVKGKFFKRMVYAARKEGKKKEVVQLQRVLGKIGVFLKVIDLVRIGDYPCEKGVCSLGKKHSFKFEETKDELKVQFVFDKNHDFEIDARSKSPFYRKVNFTLRDKRRRHDARQPFVLSLIQRDCSEAPKATSIIP